MDIEKAIEIIIAAKDETIALQQKYYDTQTALLQQSMKANFDTFRVQNNVAEIPDNTLSQEELMAMDEDPALSGGGLGGN